MNRLYGRAVALTQARQRLQRSCAGEGGLLLFTGEPGIGKSRLAEQLAGDAAQAGAQVAWGRCWEAGGAPAYWPWIQLFRELGLDADPFAAALDPGEDAEQGRFRVFDAVVRRLKQAAARRPLVLVLDDLQAADVASLLLLLLLARQLRAAPILVAGTYRDAESRLTPELAGLLVKVAREGDVLPLGRLDTGDSGAWIREAWPTASESDVAQLQRLTEGHPLFLVEALRLGPGVHARQRVVEGLGAVLDERLAHLAPSTHTLLQAGAVLGREFDGVDVAAAAGCSLDEAHRALTEASAASIVLADDGDRFRFSHVLLRDRLYAALAPSARAALHWRAGVALLDRGRDARAAVHHLMEGAPAGEPRRLAEIALAAANASLERLAFEEAARIAEQALGLVTPADVGEPLVCRLKLAAGEAAIRLGDPARGRRHCVEAAAQAQAASADDLVIRAALVYGTDLASGTVDPTMVALLRQALARVPAGDAPLRARVAARLAAALSPPMNDEDTAEMRALAAEAVTLARRIDDPATLLYVLPFAAATTRFDGPDSERFKLLQETVALARLLGQRMPLLYALPGHVTALLARGRLADAEHELASFDALLAELPPPQHRWRSRLLHALVHLVRGQFDEADRVNAEAHELAAGERSRAAMNLWMFQRFSMAHVRRRPELMSESAELLVRQFASAQSTLPFAAWLAAAAGQREQATAHLRAFRMDPTNFLGLCAVGDACVLLEDTALGEQIHRLLAASPAAGPLGALAPGSLFGPPARTLGDLAVLLGRPAEAVAHYQEAAAGCEQLGARWLADECRQAAERLSGGHPPRPTPTTPGQPRLQLRREGDVWAVVPEGGASFRLKHGKGLDYLNVLLERPGREVHVLELLGIDHRAGDAGALLDARAKVEYRQRLGDLRDQLAEAERFQDPTRARRVQEEIDAIMEQLAAAVGLGGRDRVAASDVERARINVQRRLKDAIDRIGAADPALGRYLAAAVRTGTTCMFTPI